jgi:transglutaminase-like putative cysteine protease/tetratricopeptide (TPR) repeat protein
MVPLALDAALTSGHVVAAAVLIALLSLQARQLRSPEVNRPGAWSLALVYAALILFQIHFLLTRELSPGTAVMVLVQFACFLLLFVALILGILGAVQVQAARRAGRSARSGGAGWGIGLSATLMCFFVAGVVAAAVTSARSPAHRARPAHPLPALEPVLAAPIRNEDLNFSYQPPPGWRAVADPKTFNDAATAVYENAASETRYFMIIAEKGAGELELEDVARIAEDHLRKAATQLTIRERGPRTLNGLPGIELHATAVMKGREFAWVKWSTARNGFAYQLMGWTLTHEQSALDTEAEALLRGFRMIDPEKQSPVAAPPPARQWSFRSRAWRYRAMLDRNDYSEWTTLEKDFPLADFGASCGDGCGLAVFPVRIPSPPPSIDAIGRGLIDMAGLTYPADGFTGRRALRVGTVEGFEVETHQDADDEKKPGWDWKMHVVADGRRAWLVAGFAAAGDGPGALRRDAGLAAVSFEPEQAGEEPPAPASRRDRQRLARALNEMGLYESEEKRPAEAARLFTEACRLTPDDAVLLRNAGYALGDSGQYAEGLALVEEARPRFPKDDKLAALHALLASNGGREQDAAREYGRLFAQGFVGVGHLRRYAEVLEEQGKRREALAAVAVYRKRHDAPGAALLHAELLGRAGKVREQVAVLQAAYQKTGDASVAYAFADALLDTGRKAEALREAAAMVKRFPADGDMLELRGRCELALGRTADAKRSLEQALEHDPANEQARRFLGHVSGLMGEGENSSLKEPIAEVSFPTELLGPTPAGPAPEGYGAWYQERLIAFHFKKGEPLRRTDVWRGHAVDADGVERLSSFEVTFDPLSERVFVNRVVVRDAQGKVVARGKPGDWYVADQDDGEMATQRRTVHVQVTGLRPGHDVEVVLTRRSAGPREQMEWAELTLASAAPRLRGAVILTGDVEAIATVASPAVETVRRPGAVAFVSKSPALFRPEPLREEFQAWLPMVWVAPAGATWAGEAQAYEADLAAVDRADPAAERVAADAARASRTPDAKVFALARWVQQGITYRAVEFGRRGHVPHSIPEILESRFGDCKDHALLLKRLLLAQGIPAQLALVRTDGPVRTELPSTDQFDHMIVFVPGIGGGTFVDTTDKGATPGQPPPGLGGKDALVLDGPRSRLVRIAEEPPDRITSERVVTVGDAELDVRETLQIQGPFATWMRDYLSGTPPADRVQAIQLFLKDSGPGVRVTSLQLDGLDAVDRPLRLELRYVLRNRVRRNGDELSASLPALWERERLAATPVEHRNSPFELRATTLRSVVDLHADGAIATSGLDQPAAGAFVRWRQQSSQGEAGRVRIEATLERPAAHHPAPRWDEYRQEVDRALSALETTISVRRAKAAAR